MGGEGDLEIDRDTDIARDIGQCFLQSVLSQHARMQPGGQSVEILECVTQLVFGPGDLGSRSLASSRALATAKDHRERRRAGDR